jgi:hypothetical protein
MALDRESELKGGLIDQKNRGSKTRNTVPLKSKVCKALFWSSDLYFMKFERWVIDFHLNGSLNGSEKRSGWQ